MQVQQKTGPHRLVRRRLVRRRLAGLAEEWAGSDPQRQVDNWDPWTNAASVWMRTSG